MLNITHGLVGATIAAQPISAFVSLPAAFLSHFLLDVIPHSDWGINFKKRSRSRSFLLSLADGLAAMLIVYLVYQQKKPFELIIWLGMFSAMGQDFLDAPATFFQRRFFSPTTNLHRKFHANERDIFWGLLPQGLLILLCLATLNLL